VGSGKRIELRFSNGEVTKIGGNEGEAILAAARRQGVELAASCESGDCQTCLAKLDQGSVDYLDGFTPSLSDSEMAEGAVLCCIGVPKEDVAVTFSYARTDLLPVRKYQMKVTAVDRLCGTVVRLAGDLEGPAGITFFAGQYVNIGVPDRGTTRSYSMANAPAETRSLEFFIRLLPKGEMSDFLTARVKVGDTLEVEGPYGVFYLREVAGPIVMIAGGTGLAPIVSMLKDLIKRDHTAVPVSLYFGVTRPEDFFHAAEIAELGKKFDRFQSAFAMVEPDANWTGAAGFVTGLLKEADATAVGAEGGMAYLCGPPAMVEATRAWFKARGVDVSRVLAEEFLPSA
jgi:NAD(P)H-flavin reductase/ferredoxin